MIKKLTVFLLCLGATWTLVAQKSNPDGVALLTGSAAEFECAGGEADVFEPGALLFLNRAYTAKEAPAALRGFKFIRGKIDGVRAVCKKAGVVYVVTPSPGRNPDSRAARLLEGGFQKANLPEFLLFTGNQNRSSVYQKEVAAGDALALGQWGVLVVPQKNFKPTPRSSAAAAAPAPNAIAPPAVPNFAPGAEYADSARMFQGIPGIERAANGRLWATWYAGGTGEGKDNYILLYTSGDDGKSWQRVLVLDPDAAAPVRAFDPCLWHDSDGKLWLTWAQTAPGQSSPWLFAITTTDSGNATTNWSVPRNVCDGVMMNKPTVAVDGRWLWPVARWSAQGSARLVVSRDHGATFAELGAANIPNPKERNADEHMVIERKDGSLWLLARTTYGIGESISTDGGKTWPDVAVTQIPHPVSRFFIRKLASGRLLLVRHNPPNNGKDRSHLTAFLSDDDGLTWQGGLMLDDRNGVSYPDGVQSPDGSIYVIHDYMRARDKEILMSVFTETDVLKGGLVSLNSRLRVRINQATGLNPALSAAPARNANTDGVALLVGPAAGLECAAGETASFVPGENLFLNRDYPVKEVPEALRGFKFIRGSIDRVRAVCRQAGVVYVVTPSPGRNPDSRAMALGERGFQKGNLPEFLLFTGSQNLCSVYQKQLAVDEVLDFGKWGVLVVPQKD